MDKWDALREILRIDAETFAEQAQGFATKAKLTIDQQEQGKLAATANLLAFQVAAATHYTEVMDELDRQEESLAPVLPPPDEALIDN